MPGLLFDVGIFAILELELQIVWNHLNGINLDSSVGQLIPALSVATFAVLRACRLCVFEGPLAERWTDPVTELLLTVKRYISEVRSCEKVIASYELRMVKIGRSSDRLFAVKKKLNFHRPNSI
jgi:hypothetical protein